MSMSDGSWLGTSACIERITQMSSIIPAVWAKSSLTSIPLWPYFLNLNGEPMAAPVLRSVGRLVGTGLPLWRSSIGLGSNVSTCDGPPFMNRWTTRLARARSGGALGKSGLGPAIAGGAGARDRRPSATARGPAQQARHPPAGRPAQGPPCPSPSGTEARGGS